MKNKILFSFLIAGLFFIGCKTNNIVDAEIEIPTISYEEALDAQNFDFNFTGSSTHQFNFQPDSLVGNYFRKIIDDSMHVTLATDELRFQRVFSATVPTNSIHDYEVIGFELAVNVPKSLLNETGEKFLSNKEFKNHLLSLGAINCGARQGQVTYHAFCYWFAHQYHDLNESAITITKVQEIIDHPDAFLVSATYEGDWEWGDLSAGSFRVILRN